MEFYKYADGVFALAVDGAELHMDRQEAEELFVMIGHTLQDDDISRYDESGSDDEHP